MYLLAGTYFQQFVEYGKVIIESRDRQMIRVIIIDTEATSEIHIFDPDTTCFQVFLYFVYTNHQVTESRHVRDLRTDMEMNTDQFHIFQIRQVIQHLS